MAGIPLEADCLAASPPLTFEPRTDEGLWHYASPWETGALMTRESELIGGIEAGGTKMVCAVGREDGTLVERGSFPTGDPEETCARICAFFADRGIAALGLATFGPADVNPRSPRYGRILNTPKAAWRGFDFLGSLQRELHAPMAFDTDVNAACVGELRYGACKGLDCAVYVTVGTGIGVGVCVEGRPLHGMLHPEGGHIMPVPVPGDDFPGVCPAHGTCLEGLASGPAICARFGVERASDLADDERFLELESSYLAQGLATYALVYSPQRIVLGGGVPDHVPALLPMVRQKVAAALNDYLRTPELSNMNTYICPPACGGDQGVLGAIALAAHCVGRL